MQQGYGYSGATGTGGGYGSGYGSDSRSAGGYGQQGGGDELQNMLYQQLQSNPQGGASMERDRGYGDRASGYSMMEGGYGAAADRGGYGATGMGQEGYSRGASDS